VVDGFYEEAFEVLVVNRRRSDILVEIDEKPPPRLTWNVIRANENYDLVRRRLRFRPKVAAGSERRVYYRLRVRQPSL
jgi:hypothetical protein